MCGRYAASANVDELVEEFEVEEDHTSTPARSILVNPQEPPPGTPDFNMAPTKQAPVVLSRAPRHTSDERDSAPVRQLRLLTWGLVPSWSKDVRAGVRMINARAETLTAKPAFSKAFAVRRALVPAAGWYEWQVSPTAVGPSGKPRKQPFFIHRPEGTPVAMAGLYEFWRDPRIASPEDPDAWLTTFAVITVAAEPGLDRIHDRQPLVLEREHWSRWLDPGVARPEEVSDLLVSAAPGRFTAYPVVGAVSSSRSNGPGLLTPAAAAELVGVVDPQTGEVLGD